MGTQIEVDIPCDPTQIDHTGMPWTFLTRLRIPIGSWKGPSSSLAMLKIPCLLAWLR